MKKIVFSLIVTGLLVSCSHNSTKPSVEPLAVSTSVGREDLQRKLLKKLALQTIVPLYQQFYEQTALLNKSISSFCLTPNRQYFNQVRNSWAQTLSAWLQTDALLFGPVVEEQLDFSIYFYPAKKNIINKLLKSQETITVEFVDQAGVGGQGLATMEYLLFERDQSSEKLLQNFQGQNGKRRCEYLVSAAFLLQQHAKTIHDAWHPEQGNFAEAISRAGLDSLIYTEVQQPWVELINKIFQSAEKISSNRLALALGKKTKSQPKPYKLEAWRSGHTLANIQASIQGLERLFNGGLLDWLKQNGHQIIAEKLTHAVADLDQEKLPDTDLFHLLKTNPAAIEPFYKKSKALTRIIKHDFVKVMGVQLGFNDNDGD